MPTNRYLRFVRVSTFCCVISIGCAIWAACAGMVALREQQDRMLRLQRLRWQFQQQNESVATSLNMALVTGSVSWVEEYSRGLKRLDTTSSALAEPPIQELGAFELVATLQESNAPVVELLLRGEHEASLRLALSDQITQAQDSTQQSMQSVLRNLDRRLQEGMDRQDAQFRWAVLGSFGASALLAILLVATVNRVRSLIIDRLEAEQFLEDQAYELRRLKRKAELANQAKSDFLTNMSHEIRTPLTAVLGYAELLGDMVDEEERVAAVATIRQHGENLLRVINDVLDLARIEARKVVLEESEFCPYAAVCQIVRSLQLEATKKRLSLKTSCQTLIPQTISSDPIRFRQILINLIGNSLKFTERGSVHVELSCHDRRFEVAISDTGRGLTQQQMDKLFDPFTQADASMKRNHGGSGLGLAISQELASLLGGTIHVESVVGIGSRFALRLPLRADAGLYKPGGKPVNSDESQASPSSGQELAGVRVCVADDETINRVMVSRMLELRGATVDTASDGGEAVNLVRSSLEMNQPYDVVLIDMQMPILDGAEATRQIRSLAYKGPIVALSANVLDRNRDLLLAAGCNTFLSKPFERQKLIAVMKEVLSRENTSFSAPKKFSSVKAL